MPVRSWVVVLVVAASSHAYAERFGELSAGPSYAWTERSLRYDGMAPGPGGTERATADGAGLAVAGSLTFGLDRGIRIGGVMRFGIHDMTFSPNPGNPRATSTQVSVRAVTIGPTIGISRGPIYARLEVLTGSVSSTGDTAGYRMHSGFALGTLGVSTEVGVARAVADHVDLRLGLAVTGVWGRSSEDGDHGTYYDAHRTVSALLALSVLRRL
jgi:hypothetical protein